MKISQDELIQIISDVTTLLGHSLARHIELNEKLIGSGAGVEAQQRKLRLLKTKLAHEKARLAKLKGVAKRKKELEKSNKQHGRQAARSAAT